MKLAFFVGGLSGGGAERATCSLTSYLAEKGYDVTLVTMSDETPSYYLSNKTNRIVLLNSSERGNFLLNTIKRLCRMVKFVRGQRQDCLIAMSGDIGGVIMPLLKLISNTPVIVSERSNPENNLKGIWMRIVKILARYIDGHICLTPQIAEWYKPYVGKKKIEMIPNAVKCDLEDISRISEREKIIVSSGRLHEGKNYPMQIKAFARICEKYSDYQLVIYGAGPEEENLKSLVSGLGLKDRVVFAGFCKNVISEIAKARLFLFTSNFEGMPNALMEAMSVGLPCISVDCDGGAARYLIKDGVNGILIKKNDIDALEMQMQRLLDDELFSQRLADNARKINEDLSPEKIYSKWEEVIRDVSKKI